MSTRLLSFCCVLCLFFSIGNLAFAQKKKKGKNAKEEITAPLAKPKKEKKNKVADKVKKHQKIDGLFTMYQDSTSGSVKMLIKADQIGKEFIHFYYTENGVLEAGAFRGQFRGSRVFKIEKYFNKIEFVQQNTTSYFDPESAISKAAEANISKSVLFSGKIVAGSEDDGEYLLEGDQIFLSEVFGMVKPPSFGRPSPNAYNLGRLSKGKTKYRNIRNYPENSDIIIEYVYENSSPRNFGSRAVTDARNTSILVQHSLIAMPENDFQPRFDDPRVGYFMTQVTDMNDKTTTPYRDMIHRWHLVKKDPSAAVSEPVEPITWWIENTTPKEIRATIKRAGLRWNEAFEKAGFKNAVVIKEQPDDADWDAGDIRYNVLRWTASPRSPFGGYGPSFVNPRTGQILGADIMLEHSVLGNSLRGEEIFSKAGAIHFDELEEDLKFFMKEHQYCAAGTLGQMNNMFGMMASEAFGEDPKAKGQILEEFLHFLILHEMGHTLGLNHNMKASQLHSLADIHNTAKTQEMGLTGSVMDYPSINYALDRDNQGQYWTMKPGPYDQWAIEFGYTPAASDSDLDKILARSSDPTLFFGNDADDMRAPGRGIDPRVNVGDMSNNAIDYSIERIELISTVVDELFEKFGKKDNQTYNELRIAYLIATGQLYSTGSTVSRYVGGVYVDRAFIGQEGGTKPLIPVDEATQKKAMATLSKHFFAPDAFDTSQEIYNYLQVQRRGFNFGGNNEDPKLHRRYETMQLNIMAHLLHYNVLNRIVDSELYGNEYTLSEMMTDLNDAVFKADAGFSVNTIRQHLQINYVNSLLNIIGKNKNRYLASVQSMALYNLQAIRRIARSTSGNIATRAHRAHIALLIDKALESR